MKNETPQVEKTPTAVIKKIRDAILDDVFKPGDWLPEMDLGERFGVSRSPVREALLALEKEGTVVIEPYRGAIVKPLSVEEVSEIAELRLCLITLAAKVAYRHLSPADYDLAYGLAKQITRSNSAIKLFEYNRRFWDIIFEAPRRLIRWEMFRQLDDRFGRYYPLYLKLFPDPASRPQQREVLIGFLRKGKIDEGVRAFKKHYFDVAHRMIDYLESGESADSPH
jgi:DNA-binding GntR family transcriptional regulator